MDERPLFDCDVLITSTWNTLILTNYNKIADAFNYSERTNTTIDPDNYIGWVYVDEVKAQMVRCAHEIF